MPQGPPTATRPPAARSPRGRRSRERGPEPGAPDHRVGALLGAVGPRDPVRGGGASENIRRAVEGTAVPGVLDGGHHHDVAQAGDATQWSRPSCSALIGGPARAVANNTRPSTSSGRNCGGPARHPGGGRRPWRPSREDLRRGVPTPDHDDPLALELLGRDVVPKRAAGFPVNSRHPWVARPERPVPGPGRRDHHPRGHGVSSPGRRGADGLCGSASTCLVTASTPSRSQDGQVVALLVGGRGTPPRGRAVG